MLATVLFIVCLLVELSPRINTENHFKKIGIGFVMVGALVEMAGHESPFVEVGIVLYLIANLCTAYCTKRRRRANDRFVGGVNEKSA